MDIFIDSLKDSRLKETSKEIKLFETPINMPRIIAEKLSPFDETEKNRLAEK